MVILLVIEEEPGFERGVVAAGGIMTQKNVTVVVGHCVEFIPSVRL